MYTNNQHLLNVFNDDWQREFVIGLMQTSDEVLNSRNNTAPRDSIYDFLINVSDFVLQNSTKENKSWLENYVDSLTAQSNCALYNTLMQKEPLLSLSDCLDRISPNIGYFSDSFRDSAASRLVYCENSPNYVLAYPNVNYCTVNHYPASINNHINSIMSSQSNDDRAKTSVFRIMNSSLILTATLSSEKQLLLYTIMIAAPSVSKNPFEPLAFIKSAIDYANRSVARITEAKLRIVESRAVMYLQSYFSMKQSTELMNCDQASFQKYWKKAMKRYLGLGSLNIGSQSPTEEYKSFVSFFLHAQSAYNYGLIFSRCVSTIISKYLPNYASQTLNGSYIFMYDYMINLISGDLYKKVIISSKTKDKEERCYIYAGDLLNFLNNYIFVDYEFRDGAFAALPFRATHEILNLNLSPSTAFLRYYISSNPKQILENTNPNFNSSIVYTSPDSAIFSVLKSTLSEID